MQRTGLACSEAGAEARKGAHDWPSSSAAATVAAPAAAVPAPLLLLPASQLGGRWWWLGAAPPPRCARLLRPACLLLQAYFEGEVLVDSPAAMARQYLKTDFAADLFGFIPADWMLLAAVAASGHTGEAAGVLEWLPVLRLMHLARLYRVRYVPAAPCFPCFCCRCGWCCGGAG